MQGFSKCWSIPWTWEGRSTEQGRLGRVEAQQQNLCVLSRCGGNSNISGGWGSPIASLQGTAPTSMSWGVEGRWAQLSQPSPDWDSPTGLCEHGPVRELHLRGDRCHRRGGMRLHWHCAEGQRWPVGQCCRDWGCLSRSGAKRPDVSAPPEERLLRSRTVPGSLPPSLPVCPPSVCWPHWHAAGHRHGPTLLGDMLRWPPKTSSIRVFSAERGSLRSQGVAT